MAFRWRPRPKGKNVIPFPSDRVRPPSGRSLSDIEPKPPINLEEIRRQKELQDAADIMPEGTTPPTKTEGGLSELGEKIREIAEDPSFEIISKTAKEIDKAGEASKKIIEASEARKPTYQLRAEKLMEEQDINKSTKELVKDRHFIKSYYEWKRKYDKAPLLKKLNLAPLYKKIRDELQKRKKGGLSELGEKIPAKTDTDKYIRERITNPDQPKLAGDELQKEIMKFTEGHSGNEDIISVLQRQIDDISDIGLPANREKLSQIYVRTVDKGGFKVLTINRKADDVIMGLVYPSLKGDTMIWQASPTMRRKSLVTWTPLGKTEGDYDLVTAQGKPITRRESGFQNVGEVTVTDPKKRGRSVMEGLRVILNYMEHEMQYYYDKSQGLNPTWTDPELNK